MGQKTIRKNILLCLLTMFVVLMVGCGKKEPQEPLNPAMETPLSTYRFTETHEVSGLNSGNAFFRTMIKTEDGFSILYTDMEGNLSECRTTDGGATWNE
ncbi:MAG: hypothetical protein K2K96_10385, partial [Lachnospiraceae bacterium]|nr:hypothetical protein [Lachnospiraceae bacterium]